MKSRNSLYHLIKGSPLLLRAINAHYRAFHDRATERYVFVATTGRSGTVSLSRILGQIPRVACFHEPDPLMVNPRQGTGSADYFNRLFLLKRVNIRRHTRGKSYYVETNHQFIKHFADLAVDEFGDKLRVVHLRRDPVSVAMSFYRIGSIPGKTRRGIRYLLDPFSDDNRVDVRRLIDREPFTHDFYRCLWYWYEIEARIEAFRKRYPDVPVCLLRTADLNSLSEVTRVLTRLGIEADESDYRHAIGQRLNLKREDTCNAIDRKEAEQMNARLYAEIGPLHIGPGPASGPSSCGAGS